MVPFPTRPKILERALPDGSKHLVAVIPSRLTDNTILLKSDPGYVGRLHLVGNAQLVRAWLDGDWNAIEGAFFDEWQEKLHVIPPFNVPAEWMRFRAMDWGGTTVNRPGRRGLTQSWCRDRSTGADEARLKQIDLSATVHLAFDELELRDLTFGLSV